MERVCGTCKYKNKDITYKKCLNCVDDTLHPNWVNILSIRTKLETATK